MSNQHSIEDSGPPSDEGLLESYWRTFMEIHSKNTAILNTKYSMIYYEIGYLPYIFLRPVSIHFGVVKGPNYFFPK